MDNITLLIGCLVVFLWGWRRVYMHIMRKDGRPLIAHMISLLLSLFPARFFAFAYFSVFPPEGVEPVSDTKRLLLCGLFVLSVVGLQILTRKRNFPQKVTPELIENTEVTEITDSSDLSEERASDLIPSDQLPYEQLSEDSSEKATSENTR